MSTSAVPLVAAYLFNACLTATTLGAATGDDFVEVHYGGMFNANYGKKTLWICAGDPDGTPPVLAASSTQEWVGAGARQRNEPGTVHCYAEAWNGDDDTQAIVETAYTIVGHVEDITRLDPSAGNTTNGFTSPGVTGLDLRFGMSDRGVLARVFFEFNFFARIGTI